MKIKIQSTLLLVAVLVFSSFNYLQKTIVDKSRLVGEWTRTDATCQMKITAALESGKLEMTYFKPKSIPVGKSYWIQNGTFLSIYVELLDEFNPGSYYKLNYNTERDVLKGEYFDNKEEKTNPVEFTRTKQY